MKPNNIFIAMMLVLCVASGCKKYLDVSPKSTLAAKDLFTSEVGFQEALSGLYAQVGSRSLFGDNLSMGFVSAMAQNYGPLDQQSPLVQSCALNFASAEVINYTTASWDTAYYTIAGANFLLQNLEQKKSMLSKSGYEQMKGEALGLRAYLHFEILRLFGPTYANEPNQKAIPYVDTANNKTTIPSTTSVVIDRVMQDLQAAETLLKDVDPVTTGTSLTTRRFKMNYYAVKGLQARVLLYKGDKNGAFTAAQTVVNSGYFPFVTPATVTTTPAFKNRLFMGELIMAVRVRTIQTWAENIYFKFHGSLGQGATRTAADWNKLYETTAGGATDMRYNFLLEDDQGFLFPSKFWQTYSGGSTSVDSNRLDQTVPMIRLSELYYIMAEAAPDVATGTGYLNQVRSARSLPLLDVASMTQTKLTNEITKEYQKEFLAEGQLFFYYKRLNFTNMLFYAPTATTSPSVPLTPKAYILPIPAAELEFNPNYN